MNRLLLVLAGLLLVAPAWAMKPKPDWIATPDSLGLRYQSLTLTTADHYRLAAWLVEPLAAAPDQHATLVVAANDWGNMSYQLYQARALAGAGFRVLLFDYRGFGHSQAFALNEQMLYYPEFGADLQAALAEARRQAPGQRVGVIGFSMGTILATEAAARGWCDFLITDGYTRSLPALVAYYRQRRPERPVLLPAADAATYARAAGRVRCPWLLVAGRLDPVATAADSVATAREARRGQRREALLTDAGHLGSMGVLSEQRFGDEYARAVQRFATGRPITFASRYAPGLAAGACGRR